MAKKFRRAFIEITNRCNLACGFCANTSRPETVMPPEVFRMAASQAGELAEVISPHLLGEPLTHPQFPEIIGICSELGLKVNLVTNGLLLPRFKGDLLREKCLKQISVSLHALSCLPKASRMEEIARLIKFALTKPPEVLISFRLRAKVNDTIFEELSVPFLTAFGAKLNPQDGFVKLREEVFLNFGGIFSWPGGKERNRRIGCLGLKHHFGILSNGRVVPCCADYDGNLYLGDVLDRSLREILHSDKTSAMRDSIAGRTPPPDYCASCGFSAPDS